MHEIRVTVREGQSSEVARIASAAGIDRLAVFKIFLTGLNEPREMVSAETSTPRAKAFIDGLLSAKWFDAKECSITARELRAILDGQPLLEITRPMVEPGPDVLEDLWQLSHVTPSYIGRAAAAALLLAYGMFENSPISIVVAALFVPFLSQVLATTFGLCARDRGLVWHGLKALGASTIACILAGLVTAVLYPGPFRFQDFKSPLVSFALSTVIGIAAGLASADDAGRRYLIGVAAAVQYAVFPVWFGICLARGFPETHVVLERLTAFGINVVTIAVTSGFVYSRMARRAR